MQNRGNKSDIPYYLWGKVLAEFNKTLRIGREEKEEDCTKKSAIYYLEDLKDNINKLFEDGTDGEYNHIDLPFYKGDTDLPDD